MITEDTLKKILKTKRKELEQMRKKEIEYYSFLLEHCVIGLQMPSVSETYSRLQIQIEFLEELLK